MTPAAPPRQADAVVVGAGIIGACCAEALTAVGMSVAVVERHALAGGTTAAGEGNILVSDKEPGPELALAQLSIALWRHLGEALDDDIELEAKGGLVVAATRPGHDALIALAARQRTAGVDARPLSAADAVALEPHLIPDVLGGVHYPEDLQVQPVLASSAILRRARRAGAVLVTGADVRQIDTDHRGRVRSVATDIGTISTSTVVNAAGAWGAEIADRAGSTLPVVPRRGHILVTEPLPPIINHKVYDADYVATVAGDPTTASVSSVIEGTASGTVLIGSSRELVGFDRTPNTALLARMARRAIALFPILAGVSIIRTYLGFRPYPPDGLPIIGPDERVPGLIHATGHEGAGIGLAPGTAALVAALATGTAPPIPAQPFAPSRLTAHTARTESPHAS